MLKILCIGNSFSDDATRYLYPIAQADGTAMKLFNLYIGGCSLSKHYRLMLTEANDYDLRFNSMETGLKISLRDALAADDWDYVTLQQASPQSTRYDTYQPYLQELAAYVRRYSPHVQLLIHQTWAYEQNSERLIKVAGYQDQAEMFADVKAAYNQAAHDIGAAGILPSGEMMQQLLQNGFSPIHRDTFHAHLGISRYAMAALWYDLLTGRNVEGNTFKQLDVPSDSLEFVRIQHLAHQLADRYRF